jgi:hypothetical protein
MSTHRMERTTSPYAAAGNTITIRSGIEHEDADLAIRADSLSTPTSGGVHG